MKSKTIKKKIKKIAHHDVIELLNTEKAKQSKAKKNNFFIVDFVFNFSTLFDEVNFPCFSL